MKFRFARFASAALVALAGSSSHAADEPPASEAKIPGHLDLLLRTYDESLQIIDGARRHALIESAKLVYQSDYYGGASPDQGLGVDVGAFGALRLDGGGGSGNMVHLKPDGTASPDTAWAYIGEYAAKGRLGGTAVKYGLQCVPNPLMQPYDIRSLPPTFRGLSVVSTDVPDVTLSGGSFNGVIPRGGDHVEGLSTAYDGLSFRRISYVGADGQWGATGLSAWASQYKDLWNQYYFAGSQRFDFAGDFHLTPRFDAYLTRGLGKNEGGDSHINAISAGLTAQKGPSSVILGYQVIDGDQFMDYTQETAGIFLTNAMGVDYNAPREHSVQLRYIFSGDKAGIPGWTATAWTVRGRGADARAGAAAHPDPDGPLHSLYWKNGQPASGGHQEWAFKTTYVMQGGPFKDTKIAFYVYRTRIDPQYPSKSFDDMQLMINVPIRLF